jgi:hypothetical protein
MGKLVARHGLEMVLVTHSRSKPLALLLHWENRSALTQLQHGPAPVNQVCCPRQRRLG